MTRTELRDIHVLDLAAERRALGKRLEEGLLGVLHSGQYVLGPEVERFERDFAELSQVAHGVGVSSGTDALILGLKALGIGPGDAVLTTPFTFFATVSTIAWVGARPVLADVELDTALLSPVRAAEVLAREDAPIKALLPVHLYGQLCDMPAFRKLADEHGLALLEDGAQAHGARRQDYGCATLGDACTYSFYPTKNLGAAGESGLLLTRSAELARSLRLLRDHGMHAKYQHGTLGTNARMQAFQAAVLNAKLPELAGWTARRQEIARRYDAALRGVPGLSPITSAEGSVFHQYAVRVTGDREQVRAKLQEKGIHTGIHYPEPVHFQEAAAPWGYGPGDFPNAERLAREVLCLPVHPFLAEEDVERVSASLLEAL